jgi:putative FmdB family regulatory protein
MHRGKIHGLTATGRRSELPLYEYRCVKCDRHTDKIENLKGPHLKKCPHCGGKVESVITAPAIQFKGTGWYVTDYGRKTSGGDGEKREQSEKSEKAEKAEKSEKSDKSEKAESKPSSSTKEEKKSTAKSKDK